MSTLKRSTRILRKAFHSSVSRKADSNFRKIAAGNLKDMRNRLGSSTSRKIISDKYRKEASYGGPNNSGNKLRSRSK